jgi:hypothetical protein
MPEEAPVTTIVTRLTPLETLADGSPLIRSEAFLVDLGPTPESGRSAWYQGFKAALTRVDPFTVPEVLALGKTGRMVIKIWSPNPREAVYEVDRLTDGDGPKVVPL